MMIPLRSYSKHVSNNAHHSLLQLTLYADPVDTNKLAENDHLWLCQCSEVLGREQHTQKNTRVVLFSLPYNNQPFRRWRGSERNHASLTRNCTSPEGILVMERGGEMP